MSARDLIRKHRAFSLGVAMVMILGAGLAAAAQIRSLFRSNLSGGAFYSADDGATWFCDDFAKTPPFAYCGKEAVRASVVECNGKRSVALLSRYNAKAKDIIERFNAARAVGQPIDAELGKGIAFARMSGMEYKRLVRLGPSASSMATSRPARSVRSW